MVTGVLNIRKNTMDGRPLEPARLTETKQRVPSHPTSVRWQMMGLVTATAILTYLDRLNLGIAGKFIQDEFSIPLKTMGWILSAFLLGYSLSQVPGGYLSDRYGPRRVLITAIAWWSILTATTALAPRLFLTGWVGVAWSFAVVRFLIGIGEAPSAPAYTKIVANWMGSSRRGLGSSFNLLGIGLGGVLTPMLITFVMQRWGWRTAFYGCGLLGIAAVLAWYFLATDRPDQNQRVNQEELELIARGRPQRKQVSSESGVPWWRIFTNRSIIALVLGYFCQGFPIYFFHTWLFIYLVRVRGFSLAQGGFYGATPYLAIALASPLGGQFSDFAVRRFGKRLGRRVAVWVGMFSSAILLWEGAHAANKVTAILLLATAAGCNMFASVTFWAACIDLGHEYSGSVAGLMNTFGNLGGFFSPVVTAYLASEFGWTAALTLASLVTVGSGCCWLVVDTTRGIGNPGEEQSHRLLGPRLD
jgi:ACS family glucarate transporter-like MFS transporter